MKQEKYYNIFKLNQDNQLTHSIRLGTLTNLLKDYPDDYYVIIEQAPFNWEDMTVVNRQLVLASSETIAERREAKLIAQNEVVRSKRAAEYATQTDHLFFEAMEQFALKLIAGGQQAEEQATPKQTTTETPNNQAFQAWVDAKELVRDNNPKPSLNNGAEPSSNYNTNHNAPRPSKNNQE